MKTEDDSLGGIHFSFPAFKGGNNQLVQFNKIFEELGEFEAEYKYGEKLTLACVMELFDGLHSIETFIRNFVDGDLALRAKYEVLKKNVNRGYYSKDIEDALRLLHPSMFKQEDGSGNE